MANLIVQLRDYRLTLAEILYHIPDHPNLLQSFIWQDMDMAPEYPVLRRFLRFWQQQLDGKVHSVKVTSQRLIGPGDIRFHGTELTLH